MDSVGFGLLACLPRCIGLSHINSVKQFTVFVGYPHEPAGQSVRARLQVGEKIDCAADSFGPGRLKARHPRRRYASAGFAIAILKDIYVAGAVACRGYLDLVEIAVAARVIFIGCEIKGRCLDQDCLCAGKHVIFSMYPDVCHVHRNAVAALAAKYHPANRLPVWRPGIHHFGPNDLHDTLLPVSDNVHGALSVPADAGAGPAVETDRTSPPDIDVHRAPAAGTIRTETRCPSWKRDKRKMAAPRAAWKGFLKVGSVTCGVKIVGATSEASKIHFKILNRKDGLPVRSVYADEETGKLVDAADQVKGFEIEKDEFLQIEPDDIKALKLTSKHTLEVGEFVSIDDIDTRYLEKPYYLIPADGAAIEAYGVIRDAMKNKGVAARSCVVLYQRGREVLIQPYGKGMVMTELRNHNEMVSESTVFDGLAKQKYDPDLLEIAGMLIDKKVTTFDPSKFEDTYEDALIAMIDAKRKGKKLPKPAPRPQENVINLAEVLKKSLKQEGLARSTKRASPKRKTA
ncbi:MULTISPECIES: Ku protein [unclassified Mesorhizobium]|uniref:non-homologous end joining protein Ku n=1 Tax=unclassified Mesorhizobium TaxID=325217 RepID=UPI0032AF940E